MAEYCHNSCSKCPRRRSCHGSIALSVTMQLICQLVMVCSMPCQTCRKRCFSSQHLF